MDLRDRIAPEALTLYDATVSVHGRLFPDIALFRRANRRLDETNFCAALFDPALDLNPSTADRPDMGMDADRIPSQWRYGWGVDAVIAASHDPYRRACAWTDLGSLAAAQYSPVLAGPLAPNYQTWAKKRALRREQITRILTPVVRVALHLGLAVLMLVLTTSLLSMPLPDGVFIASYFLTTTGLLGHGLLIELRRRTARETPPSPITAALDVTTTPKRRN